jgi:hypothetical protein
VIFIRYPLWTLRIVPSVGSNGRRQRPAGSN